MKQLFILGATFISLVACSSETSTVSEQTDSTIVNSVTIDSNTVTVDTVVVDTLAK